MMAVSLVITWDVTEFQITHALMALGAPITIPAVLVFMTYVVAFLPLAAGGLVTIALLWAIYIASMVVAHFVVKWFAHRRDKRRPPSGGTACST